RDKTKGAVGVREQNLAGGADGEGENSVTGVVVKDREQRVGATAGDCAEVLPEREDGAEADGCGAGEDGTVVGEDGVDPRVELEDWEDRWAADPVDGVADEVKLMCGRDRHDDVADGSEFEDEDSRHAVVRVLDLGWWGGRA